MTIVTTHYRYKRPPRKRKPNPAALAMPTIVTAKKPKPGDRPRRRTSDAAPPVDTSSHAGTKSATGTSSQATTKSAIVTARRPGKHCADVPEMTPEEHKRRGDAADALFRDMKRRIAEKLR